MWKLLAGAIVGYLIGEQAGERQASTGAAPRSGASGWLGAFLILIPICTNESANEIVCPGASEAASALGAVRVIATLVTSAYGPCATRECYGVTRAFQHRGRGMPG